MHSYHLGLRKTIRWYKKAGVHIFEIYMTSSFYLYVKNTTKPQFSGMKEFKKAIVKSLIGLPKQSRNLRPQANFHYLCPIPGTEKKVTPTRACKQCSTKERRRESRYQCVKCPDQPPLCIDPCFQLYHKQIGVARDETSSSEDE